MKFKIPEYKNREFTSTLHAICDELKMNPGQLQIDYDRSGVAVAHVQDNVIERMSDEQLKQLKDIEINAG